MDHAFWPIGPIGKPTELHLMYPVLAMNYTKYPQACKALMAYMLEADQFNKWIDAAQGYLTHCLNAYDANPVWTADPKRTVFRDAAKRSQLRLDRPVVHRAQLRERAFVTGDDVVENLAEPRRDGT